MEEVCLALKGAHLLESPHMHQDASPLGARRGSPSSHTSSVLRGACHSGIEFTWLPCNSAFWQVKTNYSFVNYLACNRSDTETELQPHTIMRQSLK